MRKIIFAGNGITAEILHEYLVNDPRYHVVAATVDEPYLKNGTFKVVPNVDITQVAMLYPPADHAIIMAAGYDNLNRTREGLYRQITGLGYEVITYIHPDAKIYTSHSIGKGSVILPGAIIEPHVKVGENTMIWCNVTLAHHSFIAAHCWVASGAVVSGKAVIMENSFIGVNATIVNEVTVGAHSVVGGGAFISKALKPYTVSLSRSAENLRFSSLDYVKYMGV